MLTEKICLFWCISRRRRTLREAVVYRRWQQNTIAYGGRIGRSLNYPTKRRIVEHRIQLPIAFLAVKTAKDHLPFKDGAVRYYSA